MAEKKVTRKIISSSKKESPVKEQETLETVEEKVSEKVTVKADEAGRTKKPCQFCQNKTNPSYTDIAVLRRYLTDRAKIVPKAKNNLCSRHQRAVSRQIKYARHLALLPFTPKV